MEDRLRLRQICLVVPELAPAVDDLSAIFGLTVCHRDPRLERFGVENALFAFDTRFIELVAPIRPGTAAGRFLERSEGRGGYIAIFDCDDPGARQAHAASIGVDTAFAFEMPGVYQCVQLHPRDCRAAMLEFDRTEGGDELRGAYWPAGGQSWQSHIDTTRVSGILGIETVSPEPLSLARHWGAILQTPVEASGPIPTIPLDGAHIGFRPGDGGEERLETLVIAANDPEAIMHEARARGRAVGTDRIDLCGVYFSLAAPPTE